MNGRPTTEFLRIRLLRDPGCARNASGRIFPGSTGNRAFCGLESARLVGSVAERADGRCTTAAQGKCFFAFEVKHIASGIRHSHGSGNQERAVVFHKHFDIRHLRTFSEQKQVKSSKESGTQWGDSSPSFGSGSMPVRIVPTTA